MASELSHGEQRELEIGMALAGKPRLLLLDEPAAGLSPLERPALAAMLRTLPTDVTVVLIEHDMDVALQVADRVTVMHEGAVVFDGSPRETASSQLVQSIYLGNRAHHHAAASPGT
jgi:branched-chain amino acid transport system ATP-binding protein